MRIGLHDADGGRYPNLALMKLAAWHRSRGDAVSWWAPLARPDLVYSSRVFSWTDLDPYLPPDAVQGGTGAGLPTVLGDEIEHARPDFGLYGIDYGIGFLTRGCPRRCSWCVVPEKEGEIRAHAEFGEFVNPLSRDLVLLDNNVLAHEHGIAQIEAMADARMRIDFNQGLDARIIAGDESVARLLSRCRWRGPIRLACDTRSQMPAIEKAITAIRRISGRVMPRRYWLVYVLVDSVDDALGRVEFLRGLDVTPFAQPIRTAEAPEPPREAKRFARWVNRPQLFQSTTWEKYRDGRRRATA
jgi:hypothetical protein